MKYRKKQIEIEAFRLSHDLPPSWFVYKPDQEGCIIETLEGDMLARWGYWIINDNGYLFPVPHDIFIATYEAVE
jgi:hypothetical protein